jgi:pimeloyl-ACP methyl ester carboxylesterase
MPTVDVDGVSLYYDEAGSGRPIVFVHGIPTDYRAWTAQRDVFSKSHRMLALSRRYASPNVREGDVSDSTIQNNAADVKGFIEKVAGGPVDLVGHSYGGFVSAYLAADHPDLVRSLILVEPAVGTLLVADQTSGSQLLGLLLRSPSVALSGRRFQSGSLKPSLKALDSGDQTRAVELNVDGVEDSRGAFAKLPEETKRMMLDNARTVAEQKTVFPRFTAAEAGRISRPTLIVNGEGSALWLRRIGELLDRAIPSARRVMISGARHFPHMQNPGDFNGQVMSFLDEGRG